MGRTAPYFLRMAYEVLKFYLVKFFEKVFVFKDDFKDTVFENPLDTMEAAVFCLD